jgi:antagonist of KipI
MASLHVVKPGMLMTIQDRGRWGWQSRGVSVAGPMDPWSHRVANALVGNGPDAAALESTLLGPEIEFDAEQVIAVVGAHFELTLDGRPVSMDAPFLAPDGSRLRFGRRLHGTRAYVAVAGGITVPPTLGSRSTHLASAMGGLDGRALKAGDSLPLGTQEWGRESFLRRRRIRTTPDPFLVPNGMATVRVMAGPHQERFGMDALDVLQSAPYAVGHNSDRMGFRLEGPTLASVRGFDGAPDFISDATPLGSIQVPGSGQPIVLMADRQTTGGYPTIATVITADIGVVGQLGPGDSVSFVVCSLGEAMAALVERERAVRAIEAEGSV